ncbi:galanin-like peptide isoform X2 [Panthera leo]|uniref:galanin-like peptide isoform X2 n=1 Tax=Panthera leo TaxID=9689 RepID=UPI001C6A1BE8|nr:galanin-like peptide isoform X2 [Panthera leo]
MAEEAGPSTVPATSWVPSSTFFRAGAAATGRRQPWRSWTCGRPLPQIRPPAERISGKAQRLCCVARRQKADGLPNPHPQQATKKSPRETLAKPETADPGELSKKAPREGEVLQS